MDWSPDMALVASGDADGAVRVADPVTGHPVACLDGHAAPVWAVCWEPGGDAEHLPTM